MTEQAEQFDSIVNAFNASAAFQLASGAWVFELRPGVLWFPSRRSLGWIVLWTGDDNRRYTMGEFSIYPIRRRFNHTTFAKFCDAVEKVFWGQIPSTYAKTTNEEVFDIQFGPSTVFIDRQPRVKVKVVNNGDVEIVRSVDPIDSDEFNQAFDPPLQARPSREQSRWMAARFSQMKMYATFGEIIADVAQFWDLVTTRVGMRDLMKTLDAIPKDPTSST